MANVSKAGLMLGNSLLWVTERPFLDVSQRSPNFWLQDSQYYLQFVLQHADKNYCLTLRDASGCFQPFLKLNVTAFILGRFENSSFYGIQSPRKANIWSCDSKTVDKTLGLDEYHGRLAITCVFTSDRPLNVQLSRSVKVHTTTQTDFDRPLRLTSDLESLSHDLSNLLEQKATYPDVQLCGGRTFPAHRNILAARSEVFAAMFRNEMAERETGTVAVTDMDAEALDALLKYVYSGKLPGDSELTLDAASSLYSAGDKYRILALKEACSQLMVGRLTTENCLHMLVLAEVHNDEDFKDRVVDFVAPNLALLKKEDWSEFDEDHPELANSVYRKCLATKQSMQA